MGMLREILDPHFVFATRFMPVYWSASVVLWWGSTRFCAGSSSWGRPAADFIGRHRFRFRFARLWAGAPHAPGHFAGDERLLALIGGLALPSRPSYSWLDGAPRARFRRRPRGTLYAVAGAWSILLLVNNQAPNSVCSTFCAARYYCPGLELIFTLIAFGFVAAGMLIFKKEFLLVSFDREMAVTLRKTSCFGFLPVPPHWPTISMAVLIVGPWSLCFLLIPTLPLISLSQHAPVHPDCLAHRG